MSFVYPQYPGSNYQVKFNNRNNRHPTKQCKKIVKDSRSVIYNATHFINCFIVSSLTTKTLFVLRYSFFLDMLYTEYVNFDENENDWVPCLTSKVVGSYFMAPLGCDGLLKGYVIKIANR